MAKRRRKRNRSESDRRKDAWYRHLTNLRASHKRQQECKRYGDFERVRNERRHADREGRARKRHPVRGCQALRAVALGQRLDPNTSHPGKR